MHFQTTILCFGLLFCLNLRVSDEHSVNGELSSLVPAATIAQGIASLGRKLIASLEADTEPNENVLISPANIFHAVAMVHMAAGGNTLTELSNFMGIPLHKNYSKSDIHYAASSFYQNISTDDANNPVTVNIADAFFVQNGFPIKENYRNDIVRNYQAMIENIDFGAGEEAAKTINHWVSEKTKNRITKIVDPLESDTAAVIASTLYFKAKWNRPFNKAETHNGKFFSSEGELDVPMMTLNEYLPYVNNTELQFESIDLLYEDFAYALNIILPYPNQTIKNLIPKLRNISVDQIMEKSNSKYVAVRLPRIKFNVANSLVKAFQRLGVQDLFTGRADLSYITDRPLVVSQILHNAEIEIQEAGTVATAATVIQHRIVGGSTPRISVQFHVNRPFIINIYNKRTLLNLFSGIVYKPAMNP